MLCTSLCDDVMAELKTLHCHAKNGEKKVYLVFSRTVTLNCSFAYLFVSARGVSKRIPMLITTAHIDSAHDLSTRLTSDLILQSSLSP